MDNSTAHVPLRPRGEDADRAKTTRRQSPSTLHLLMLFIPTGLSLITGCSTAPTETSRNELVIRHCPGDAELFGSLFPGNDGIPLINPSPRASLVSLFGPRRSPMGGGGRVHQGIDLAAPRGTPIHAAAEGSVVHKSDVKDAYGRYIRIRHNSTCETSYAHLDGFAADTKAGQMVRKGQVIGYTGSTGNATGPHLHFELVVNGKKINPLQGRP